MAKLHFLKSVTDTINTSFILESGDTLLVVDGGGRSETPYVYEYLKTLGGHVTAWFITHVHGDHIGCLRTLVAEHPDIIIDRVYHHFPSDEFFARTVPFPDFANHMTHFREAIAAHSELTVAQTGDIYTYDEGSVAVRVLRTPDESIENDAINNSSVVYRFEADRKSVLFMGDLGVEGGQHLLDTVDHDLIRCDYVQMAHHGQNGVTREVYEVIRPTYCLWPTPTWLWNNWGDGGYDTGEFNTVVTRGWISAMHCVKRHYLMQEGDHVIDLGSE